MRLSVERLRWGLLAGALLLVGVVVVLVSYGRYRAMETLKEIVKRSGATISHETDGITWSQASGGKTIFVLHAKHGVPHGDGKYTLQDGSLLLYGANGQPTDKISGAQFEYDEKLGVAHAAGQVDMDIVPPEALTGAGNGGKAGAAAQVIHVRTSGLTYVKKLGVAATEQDVEIDYAGMHGHAKGAEFDTGQSVVHLLADVRAEGVVRGTPATVTATKADLDRNQNVINLTSPVMTTGGRTGSASSAVLHMRKDGTLEMVDASGGVTLKQDTRTITAATVRATMNERSQMQRADLAGGVALLDTNAQRPTHAIANTAKITCDAAGYPTSVVMDGSVALTAEDRRGGGPILGRQMGAEHVTLTMERAPRRDHKGGSRVSEVHAQGGAWARGNSVVQASGSPMASGTKPGGLKLTSIAGDDLRLALTQDAAGKDQPQSLSGNGRTRIEQKMPDGTVQTSTGDALEASFAQAPGSGRGLEIASAEQTGHVEVRSVPGKQGVEPSEAVAERAQLDGASNVITLSGRPRLTRGDTSVTADTVRMMQQTGDAVASGNVAGTFVNANAKAGGSAAVPAVTHALAQEATLHRTTQTMELKGTDAAPARMWQGANQVEAANLLLDRAHDAMQAWPAKPQGVVRAVFANEGATTAAGGSASTAAKGGNGQVKLKGDRVVRVTSDRMDYFGASHQAIFRDDVLVQAEDGQVRAQRGVAFLTPKQGAGASAVKGQPDPTAASVERIVMSGAVKVEQPGRTATGDQLLYTAATGEFVLTGTAGHPPHVVDDKQGNMTGETLMFRAPDSTIVVGGTAPGLPGSHRVHTETTIKK